MAWTVFVVFLTPVLPPCVSITTIVFSNAPIKVLPLLSPCGQTRDQTRGLD